MAFNRSNNDNSGQRVIDTDKYPSDVSLWESQTGNTVATGTIELAQSLIDYLQDQLDSGLPRAALRLVITENKFANSANSPTFKGFAAIPDNDKRGGGQRKQAPSVETEEAGEEPTTPTRRRATKQL